jgi:tRNA1Val (adenine37-N6)-methyltransferase
MVMKRVARGEPENTGPAKLLVGMHELSLEPKRLRIIHPDPNLPAKLILIEGCKDAGEELRVLPPIFLNRP